MFHILRKGLDRALQWLAAVSMVVLVLVVSWQVVIRFSLAFLSRFDEGFFFVIRKTAKFLSDHSQWTQELPTFLMIWVGLLGASIALKHNGHLGIDFFAKKMPRKVQGILSIGSFVLIGAFAAVVMVGGGGNLVKLILMRGQVCTTMPWLKMGYVYMAIPISGFFMVIYSLELLVDAIIRMMKGPGSPTDEDDDDDDDDLEKSIKDELIMEGVE